MDDEIMLMQLHSHATVGRAYMYVAELRLARSYTAELV